MRSEKRSALASGVYSEASSVKSKGETESYNFSTNMHIFNRIPIGSCKFLKKKITGSHNFNTVLKFSKNEDSVLHFAFLDK